MDLFPGQSPISPMQVPSEHPGLRAYMQGLDAGKEIPTPAKAIADAFTTGVSAYHKETQQQQVEQQNYYKLEADKLALQQQQASMQNLDQKVQLEAEATQAQRDALARQTRERQEEDEVIGVIQSGNTQALSEGVLSGKYAGVFARNPKLEEIAVKSAAPHWSPDTRDIFLKQQSRRANDQTLQRQQLKNQEDYSKAESGFHEHDTTKEILAKFGDTGLTDRELAKRIDFVPMDSIKVSPEGMAMRTDDNQAWQPNPMYADMSHAQRSKNYYAIDRKSMQVLATDVLPEYKKITENYRATAHRVGGGSIGDSRIEQIVKQVNGQQSGILEERGANVAKPQEAPKVDPLAVMLTPKSAKVAESKATNISLEQFNTEVSRLPLHTDSNRPQYNSKEVVSLFSSALNVSDVAAKKSSSAIKNYLGNLNTQSTWITDPARDRLVKELLSNEPVDLTGYDEEAVNKHNAQVKDMTKAIEQWKLGPKVMAPPIPPPGGAVLVNSPEELYVLRNYARMSDRVNSITNQLTASATKQMQAQSQKELSRQNILAAVARFK